MKRTRRRLAIARVVLGLVAASSLLGSAPAGANAAPQQVTSSLAGLQGRASASGVRVNYMPQGLLPIASPVDFGSPDALATIASGPATFARASVADPGDLLANPDALFSLASSDYQPGTIPPYPYRVSASSGVGEPTAESNPAPGLGARVAAERTGSSASASMPGLSAPAVATAGSITSSASTTTDGATVTVHARTEISRFDLLGLLTIESIVTDLTATSNGTDTTVAGGTTVTGAAFLGQPVTIDASGVHPGEPSGPPNPVLGALVGSGGGSLDELLEGAGIRVTLAGPVAQEGDTAGQLTADGLRIDLDLSGESAPLLGELADALPPIDAPLVEDLLVAARARHLTSIAFGQGSVSLTARTARPSSPSPAPARPTPSVARPAPSAASMVGAVPTAGPATVPAGSAPAPAVAASTELPPASLASGIGALAALALLAQPLAGSRLARVAGAQLAPGTSGSCPREGR